MAFASNQPKATVRAHGKRKVNMDLLTATAFAFLAGLTLAGLAGSVMELAAGRRLSFGEPFVSPRNVARSLGSAAAAGPFMLLNDALRGWRAGAVSTMFLISCALTSFGWLLATGIVAIDLASRASWLLS